MDISQILITIIGFLTILWIIWYFFFPKKKITQAKLADKIQEINIKVKGGYDPNLIEVQNNIPVKINFYRDEDAGCSAIVKFSDFKIMKELTAFQTTSIEFTPHKEGEYEFTCGMGMLRGKIIIKPSLKTAEHE